MGPYFELNVSYMGKHLFATDPRSVKDKDNLENLYIHFKEKFPVCEGYQVTVTYWECKGQVVAMA